MAPACRAGNADPGLAQERTELAWTRTAISFAALGGAVLKTAPVAGILVLAFSAAIWETGRMTGRAVTGRGQARRLLLVTVVTTGISLAALVLTYLLHSRGGLP